MQPHPGVEVGKGRESLDQECMGERGERRERRWVWVWVWVSRETAWVNCDSNFVGD